MAPQTASDGSSSTPTTTATSLHPSWVRPEARLYPWTQLTEEQRRAAAQAAAIFQALASRPWPPERAAGARASRWSFLHQIDVERFNHNVLIDGGRGTGKTVVLLHLVHYWNQMLIHDGQPDGKGGVGELDHATREWVRLRETEGEVPGENGRAEAGDFGSRFVMVPVGIVDLQPLPRSTNLELFLCSHFERIVTAIEQGHGREHVQDRHGARDDARARKAPWSALRGDLRSRELWSELRDAAALGSDHIQQRRAHLDAETYALELEAAERSRKLTATFGRFIDALVNDFRESPLRGGAAWTPFFVLAVDDADMNLQRSAYLLDCLRQLTHDRVGYVLTGDSDLFTILLRNGIAGGMRESLRRLDLEERDEQIGDDFAVSQMMATQIYDKVIPSAHRCVLGPLALRYRREQLVSALRNWRLPVEPLPSERLDGDAAPTSVIHRPLDTYFQYYSLPLAALPDTLRGLQDLRELLMSGDAGYHSPVEATPDVPRLIRDLWRDRLDGSSLNPSVRQLLRDVVRIEELEEEVTPATGAAGTTQPQGVAPSASEPSARSGKFVVQSTRLSRDIYPRRLQHGRISIAASTHPYGDRAGRPGEATFSVGELLGYEFRYQDEVGDTIGLLSKGAAGALMLATDVAADLTTGTFVGKPLSPEKFDHPLLTVSVYDDFFSRSFEFCWPLPDWDAFVDFHVVSRRWSRVVREVISIANPPTGATLLDALVFPFVAIAAEVAFGRYEAGRKRLFDGLPGGCDSLEDAWLMQFRAVTKDLDRAPDTAILLPQKTRPQNTATLKRMAARLGGSTPSTPGPGTPPVPLSFRELWEKLGWGLVELSGNTRVQRDFDARDWVRTRVPLLAFAESGLSRAMQDAVLFHLVQPVLMPERRMEMSAEGVRATALTSPGITAARRLRARNARLSAGKERSVTLEAWRFQGGSEEFSTDDLVSLLLLPFGDVTDTIAASRRMKSTAPDQAKRQSATTTAARRVRDKSRGRKGS